MHELSEITYLARKDDPTSPFIWGHAARMLIHGGEWDPSKPVPVTTRKRQIRREVYEGEDLLEPDPTDSNARTTAQIVRYMLLAGFTAQEVGGALRDPQNAGGAFWRWSRDQFQTTMIENCHLDRSGLYRIIPMDTPYRVKVTTNSFHACPLLTVVDGDGITHGIKIRDDGKVSISLPTHITIPGKGYMGRKEVVGEWESAKGFKVEIQRDKVLAIIKHLNFHYVPVSQAQLKRDLSSIIRNKGILEGYLKWLEDHVYLSWSDEVHPVTLTNGNVRRMKVKVAQLTGKALPTPDLHVGTLDLDVYMDDPHEWDYLNDDPHPSSGKAWELNSQAFPLIPRESDRIAPRSA